MNLKVVPFTADEFPRVQHFYCGDTLPSELAAEWIKQGPAFRGALQSMHKYGTEVWLYLRDAIDEEHLVGFASLGKTKWKIPPPDGPVRSVGFIPMMAVSQAFQGKACRDGKNYSVTIIEDVLTKAREHEYRQVCLTVNQENTKAIRLYERHGFQQLSGPDGRGNLQMMMLLD